MIILEDSFIEITIAELIEIPNDETTIAPIKTYKITLSAISITGRFAALTKLWSDLIDDIKWNYVNRVYN